MVSPGNRSKAIRKKASLYQINLVETWIVYPNKRQIKIYRPEQPMMQLSAQQDAAVSLPPTLPQTSISLADIFKL